MGIQSVVVSTVEPALLSLSIAHMQRADVVALMYQHFSIPVGPSLSDLRTATSLDLEDAIAFVGAATQGPEDFLRWYVAERIERRELYLHVMGGEIAASGECRVDERVSGYAHLGLVVGRKYRSRGMGTQMMNALVKDCSRRQLKPLCSTEPDNKAARHLIKQAGFCSRHRVFRLHLG
jgi:ribosomal protein S18 acetylase RimI-like enzyme